MHLYCKKGMLLLLESLEVKQDKVILKERFFENADNWEIVNNNEKFSAINKDGYNLINRTEAQWIYFDFPVDLNSTDDFIIKLDLKLLKAPIKGHFGLVWGFNAEDLRLNRFVLSSSIKKFGVIHFDRFFTINLQRVYYKSNNIRIGNDLVNALILLKIKQQLYFFINDFNTPVFQCHESSYPWIGNHIGFYIEPKIELIIQQIYVAKISTSLIGFANWDTLIQDVLA